MRKLVIGVSDQVRHKPKKMARGSNLWIEKVEGLYYYLCTENKGADQLRDHCAADLHFCFGIFRKQFFS